MWEVGSSNPGRVKIMTYNLDTYNTVEWRASLVEEGRDCLSQCEDNVTESQIRPWGWPPGVPVGQYYKVTMSVQSYKLIPIPDMNLDVCRT